MTKTIEKETVLEILKVLCRRYVELFAEEEDPVELYRYALALVALTKAQLDIEKGLVAI